MTRSEELLESIWKKAAHDLKTPLCTTNICLFALEKYMPQLIAGYEKAAEKQQLSNEEIIPKEIIERLKTKATEARREIKYTHWQLSVITRNITYRNRACENRSKLSVKNCLDKTKEKFYLFYNSEERQEIQEKITDFEILGDEKLIIHVLYNLLSNAEYYIRAAGKGEITIHSSQTEKYHQIHIKDTGKGIDAKNLPMLFEKYFTTEASKMGLGLHFCKQAMQSMGGDILCHSKKGDYAEFILQFPRI